MKIHYAPSQGELVSACGRIFIKIEKTPVKDSSNLVLFNCLGVLCHRHSVTNGRKIWFYYTYKGKQTNMPVVSSHCDTFFDYEERLFA